jgi:hypothetical protein
MAAAARSVAAARQRFLRALREADDAGAVPPEVCEVLAAASTRLAECARERRIAEAAETVRRLRAGCLLRAARRQALAEAEAALDRLRERHSAAAAAAKARAIVAGAAVPERAPLAVAADPGSL